VSPRYDIPKAAPDPLREVQLLVNSVDLHNEVEWLDDWLCAHGLDPERDRDRATNLREALRVLLLANNGRPFDAGSVRLVNDAASRISLRLDDAGRLHLASDGDALDEVVAVVLRAMLEGTWKRLKACRNCYWSFYDFSPNRSATWCSMQICGNREKTRAYRRRHKTLS
jgi:predicted RNA-binding Zn ribbon-like protein